MAVFISGIIVTHNIIVRRDALYVCLLSCIGRH